MPRNIAQSYEAYKNNFPPEQFERSGLFSLLQQKLSPRRVLYPGCSLHIAPAFFFPYVLFVDRNAEVAKFFSERRQVDELIARKRESRGKYGWDFLQADFAEPTLPQSGFDLLLALSAGNVGAACGYALSQGGYVLADDLLKDASEISKSPAYKLLGRIGQHGRSYEFMSHTGEPGARRDGKKQWWYLFQKTGPE